jgi:putative flippase GtrA
MFTFLKAQTSSIIATAVDFLITILLVQVFGCWYLLGTIFGTVSGAITHFLISRNWVFEAGDERVRQQVLKYLLVWLVYLILSTALIYLLTERLKFNYIVSKVLVASTLSVSYNFLFHKHFVFRVRK